MQKGPSNNPSSQRKMSKSEKFKHLKEQIRKHIKEKYNDDLRNDSRSIIELAVYYCDYSTVKSLLECGANINTRDCLVSMAFRRRDYKMAELVIGHGAKLYDIAPLYIVKSETHASQAALENQPEVIGKMERILREAKLLRNLAHKLEERFNKAISTKRSFRQRKMDLVGPLYPDPIVDQMEMFKLLYKRKELYITWIMNKFESRCNLSRENIDFVIDNSDELSHLYRCINSKSFRFSTEFTKNFQANLLITAGQVCAKASHGKLKIAKEHIGKYIVDNDKDMEMFLMGFKHQKDRFNKNNKKRTLNSSTSESKGFFGSIYDLIFGSSSDNEQADNQNSNHTSTTKRRRRF